MLGSGCRVRQFGDLKSLGPKGLAGLSRLGQYAVQLLPSDFAGREGQQPRTTRTIPCLSD